MSIQGLALAWAATAARRRFSGFQKRHGVRRPIASSRASWARGRGRHLPTGRRPCRATLTESRHLFGKCWPTFRTWESWPTFHGRSARSPESWPTFLREASSVGSIEDGPVCAECRGSDIRYGTVFDQALMSPDSKPSAKMKSGSQASPIPSPSMSDCSGLGISGQLSASSGTPSPSRSVMR